MANIESSPVAANLFESVRKQKPSTLISTWKERFHSLAQLTKVNEALDANLRVEISEERRLENGWRLADKITGESYVVSKKTTTKTLNNILRFFVDMASQTKAVVSLSLPDEGPLGERGVEGFDDYAFFPLAKNESRCYKIVCGQSQEALIQFTVDNVDAIGDESVVSRIGLLAFFGADELVPKQPNAGPDSNDRPRFDIISSLYHIQQLNWPPHGYPPSCTYSVLRMVALVHKKTKGDDATILVTCSDGAERSGTFVALCCCVARLQSVDPKACWNHIAHDMVASIRRRCPLAIRRLGSYFWLNYAVVEFCYSATFSLREEKEEKETRNWLMKLRKATYDAAIAEHETTS